MATSDNNTRTSRNPKKRAASASTEPAARKRTAKKTADTPLTATAPKIEQTAPAAMSTPAVSTPAVSNQKPARASMMSAAPSQRSVPVVTGARPDPAIAKVVDADERRRMIGEAAYHKFLQRGPGNGTPAQDWCEAEAEIDALLAEQYLPRTQ